MNIALLKSKTDKINITTQQESIIRYARLNSISLDTTEIESSHSSTALEDRGEFKGFLRSLNFNDTLLIYDLWVFSHDMGEIVKILDCLVKRDISVHICSLNLYLDEKMKPLELLSILAQYREKNILKKSEVSQGRPKGRMSKSKFDTFRSEIVELLTKGDSVSKISRTLEVSRTSLKDYINSRGLKALVEAKKSLLVAKPIKKEQKVETKQECSLIKERI